MSHPHIVPVRTNVIVFGALMLLLVATVGLSYLPLGHLHLTVAMLIAATKAVLILLYFMHVRYGNRLTWVFSGAAFFWLGILLVICLADYTSRGWLDILGK